MMRKKIVLLFILLLGLGLVFLFRGRIIDFYNEVLLQLPKIQKGIANSLTEEISKKTITPGPLRKEEDAPSSYLTKAGIIEWTNIQRENYGLPSLSENTNLNKAANEKMQDMFKNQYFAHTSPSGTMGAGELAEETGYQFIIIGENLAMGNFANDEEVVQAWMDSPGHRANILNSKYQDIGVAAGIGTFEGKSTWIAVQTFGLPLASCPKPDHDLLADIENYQNEAKIVSQKIELLLAEIKNMRPKRGDLYNQKVTEYNNLVSQYNSLQEKIKVLVSNYNGQVVIFNDCVR